MQLSRGKLVASFAAVILGGVLLAMLGMSFTSSNYPPIAPAAPAPATPAPATPGLAAPEKQAPLKPALPIGISPQLYALAVPPGREPTAQLAALGEKLFKDKRLSVDDSVACETCHDPTKGFTDHRGNSATSAGVQDQHGQRNAPTVLNAMFQTSQFWDGRAPALEDQATLPILNPIEMGQKTPGAVVAKVARIQEYSDAFKSLLGHDPIYEDIAAAIAARADAIFRQFAVRSLPGPSARRRSVAGRCSKARGAAALATPSTRCRRCSPTRSFTISGSPRTSKILPNSPVRRLAS
jgi:cytochrome c peroxidase